MTTPPEGGRPEDGNEGASPSARRSGTFSTNRGHMWHPTDDRSAMSPAPVVAAAMPLWDWAAAQAEAAKQLDEKIAAALAALAKEDA